MVQASEERLSQSSRSKQRNTEVSRHEIENSDYELTGSSSFTKSPGSSLIIQHGKTKVKGEEQK